MLVELINAQAGPILQRLAEPFGVVRPEEGAGEAGLRVHVEKVDSPSLAAKQDTEGGGRRSFGRAPFSVANIGNTPQVWCHAIFRWGQGAV